MTEDKIEEGQVIEDARTGEIVPKGSPPVLQPGILAQININQVGTLHLEQKEIDVIEEALDPKDVQIRPDGLVYLPWIWYNKRLNRAFGYLAWGLIPQGAPQVKNMGNATLIVWLHWLVVRGIPISMAGGETSYQPSNYTMSYGDAVEGARSNSLARNCKNLGMALELWDHEWVENWKKQFAETYKDDKGKTKWRKKGQKSAQKSDPKPQNQTQENKADENNSVAETKSQQEEKGYSVSDLRKAENVVRIKEAIKNETGMEAPIPTIMNAINSLDKTKTYSISSVVSLTKAH